MTQTLLCYGFGYSARALARLVLAEGWRVIGTTRSKEKCAEIEAMGVEPLLIGTGDLRGAIGASSHVLMSAPPSETGSSAMTEFMVEIVRDAKRLDWFGYLSTTGVYGDHSGGWVDETTPLTPTTVRGSMRVTAEKCWQDVADLPLHIFRLAGIYGSGRGPFAKVKNGTARRIIKPGQVFSRIHVEDIAQVLRASIARPNPGAVYNVCDDDPAPPQDVLAYAAELLGVPVPPAVAFETAEMTEMARSFYAENKRVRNDRIKNELGVVLKFPDYRSGLDALLREEPVDR